MISNEMSDFTISVHTMHIICIQTLFLKTALCTEHHEAKVNGWFVETNIYFFKFKIMKTNFECLIVQIKM